MFIHFGHAASRGWELSWQMTGGVEGQHPSREPVACTDYFSNASSFDPSAFDAEQWADEIARSGAAYAVFTAKHHDGFAMYDTAQSEYSIVNTAPFRRDLLAELLEALRRRELRVGVYFSMPDWHHPDYPAMTDETVTRPYALGSWQRTAPDQWRRYRGFFLAQLTELLTGYGTIDVLWLDGEFEHTAEEWDYASIREHVRELQPDCLVNDRCVGFGDFATPEQQLPDRTPVGPWELCMTMNDSWGWTADDQRWKSIPTLVSRLAETAAGGGNLLLNVGPRGDGAFPEEATDRLAAIGAWMRSNGEAIGGVLPLPDGVRSPLPAGMKWDDSGQRIFVYCTMRPYDTLTISGLPVQRIASVYALGSSTPLDYTGIPSLPHVHAGDIDPLGDVEISIPSELAAELIPVIAISITADRLGHAEQRRARP